MSTTAPGIRADALTPSLANHEGSEGSYFRIRVEGDPGDEHSDLTVEPMPGIPKSWAASILSEVDDDPKLKRAIANLAHEHGCRGSLIAVPLCRTFLDEDEPSLSISIDSSETTAVWVGNLLAIAERLGDESTVDPADLYGEAS